MENIFSIISKAIRVSDHESKIIKKELVDRICSECRGWSDFFEKQFREECSKK